MTARKSARFRVGRCCSPYPIRYRQAFAFSAFLYPHHQQLPSRSACPVGSSTGLPCSAYVSERVGPFLSAGDGFVHDGPQSHDHTAPLTFWFKPHSTFGLSRFTTFIGSSHMLGVTLIPR